MNLLENSLKNADAGAEGLGMVPKVLRAGPKSPPREAGSGTLSSEAESGPVSEESIRSDSAAGFSKCMCMYMC